MVLTPNETVPLVLIGGFILLVFLARCNPLSNVESTDMKRHRTWLRKSEEARIKRGHSFNGYITQRRPNDKQ